MIESVRRLRRTALLAATLIAAVALGTPGAAAQEVETRTTPGGTTYRLIPVPDVPSGVVAFTWPNARATSVPGREGLYLLAPQLTLSRVDGRRMAEISEDLTDEGQGIGLFNSLYATTLVLSGERGGDLDRVSDIAAKAIAGVANAEADDLARLVRDVRDNLAASERDPILVGQRALGALVASGESRLVALTNRPLSSFEDLTVGDVAAWAERVFHAEPIVVAAGPIDPDAVERAIDTVLADVAAADEAEVPEPIAFRNLDATVAVRSDAARGAIVVAGVPLRAGDGQMLVPAILSSGPGSVLFERLRRDLGAAYEVRTMPIEVTRDQTLLLVVTIVPPERAGDTVAAVREAIGDLARGGLGADLVALAKERAGSVLARVATDPGALANIATARTIDGDDPSLAALRAEVEAATPETLLPLLAPTLDGVPAVVVGPAPDAVPDACVVDVPEDAADC